MPFALGIITQEIFEGHFCYISLLESLFTRLMINDFSQQIHFFGDCVSKALVLKNINSFKNIYVSEVNHFQIFFLNCNRHICLGCAYLDKSFVSIYLYWTAQVTEIEL